MYTHLLLGMILMNCTNYRIIFQTFKLFASFAKSYFSCNDYAAPQQLHILNVTSVGKINCMPQFAQPSQ